jgi:hypothetical protein
MKVVDLKKLSGSKQMLGATLATDIIRKEIYSELDASSDNEYFIGLNFEGISVTNASFVKALALRLYLCGRLFAKSDDMLLGRLEKEEVIKANVFPFLINPSAEVLEEFDEVFSTRQLPFIWAKGPKSAPLKVGEFIGKLHHSLKETYQLLEKEGQLSPRWLREKFQDGSSSGTKWNNRLNELNALRVVTRHLEGREYIYKPVLKGR